MCVVGFMKIEFKTMNHISVYILRFIDFFFSNQMHFYLFYIENENPFYGRVRPVLPISSLILAGL